MKTLKDSDSNLVSNENFSKILWPSGWALGQTTWAKMTPNLLHLWRHSQKICTPQLWIFDRLSSVSGSKVMILNNKLINYLIN